MKYPNKLRDVRVKLNIKASSLSELLGVTFQHYYAIERGERQLSATHLNKLTAYLKVSTDEILGKQPLTNLEGTKKPKDLSNFLEQAEVMFDGETYKLDADDKEKLRSALEFAFWHAKEKNKRKKK
jgi:transcriptional regulator with XRE-family HTH domain